MSDEFDRIAFMQARDGQAGAVDFCKRTMRQYRAALKTPYGKAYRRQLIESILTFRKYLRRTGHGTV